jgi:hypothetical protein
LFPIIAPSAVTALIATGNAIPMSFLFDLSHLSSSDVSSSVYVIAHARRLLGIFAAGLAKGGRSLRLYLSPSMHVTDGLTSCSIAVWIMNFTYEVMNSIFEFYFIS